jgi:hypothetical protein
MIVRVWQGVAPRSKSGDNVAYIRDQLMHSYLQALGNRGAILLSRTRPDHTEFLLLSFWESASSLEALMGPDVDGALPRELINQSPVVKNYEVVTYRLLDEGHRY